MPQKPLVIKVSAGKQLREEMTMPRFPHQGEVMCHWSKRLCSPDQLLQHHRLVWVKEQADPPLPAAEAAEAELTAARPLRALLHLSAVSKPVQGLPERHRSGALMTRR